MYGRADGEDREQRGPGYKNGVMQFNYRWLGQVEKSDSIMWTSGEQE